MGADLKPLPPWLGLDERKAKRWPFEWPTSFSTAAGSGWGQARVIDLSTHGCLLSIRETVAIGRYIRLALPHGIEIDGWIAWASTERAGFAFARLLPSRLVEQIVAEQVRYAV